MHINIDNTLNGGENTRSGENTHTYPTLGFYVQYYVEKVID